MFVTLELSTTAGALLFALVTVVCWFALSGKRKEKHRNPPPSLPRLPLIGSLPFLSGLSNLHVCLMEKCSKYGKIFSLIVGSRYVVVLNGHELIREALVKNASEFSGRGEMYAEKYIWPDHGKGVIMCPASDTQRKTRSFCLSVLKSFGFGRRAVMEERIQEEVTHLLQYVRDIDGKAWNPAQLLEYSTMNVIYNLMFGKRFPHNDIQGEEVVHMCHKLVDSVDVLIDVFPIIRILPNIRRQITESAKVYDNYMEFCQSKVEECLSEADNGCNNFVKELVKIAGAETFSERDIAAILRDLIGAGTETTSSQLNWALILLANHPDVQSRLQQEINSVVPRDRLPSLDDKSRLSYLDAVILEVFRFRTATPLSVPRQTLDDTIIGGYNIPAGSEIIVNLWSAHMDPEVWTEPEKFNPDRFLDESGDLTNRELMITFSHGKRSCLGEILARQEMFLFLAALVQQFNILPPEGEVKVKDEMRYARTLTAVDHTMRLVPRDFN